MVLLFDVIARTEERARHNRETLYSHLNISASSLAELIRVTLEQWFSGYPDEHKAALKEAFIAQGDQSAFTELLIYELLKRIGAENVVVHPSIQGTDKRPDFKAELSGCGIILEVKNSIDIGNPRIEEFCDGFNGEYETTGYMLDLSFEGPFDTPISVKNFIRFIDAEAAILYRDTLRTFLEDPDQIPTWIFQSGNDKIHVRPIPSCDLERIYERPIGAMSPYSAYVIDNAETLRRSLKKKASRYGVLSMPYIIVINFEAGFLEDIDIAQALFGTELFRFSPHGGDPDFSRANDGLWAADRNTRVSGVLIVDGADPWSFSKRKPVLWLNPWAAYPLDTTQISGVVSYREVNQATGRLEMVDGMSFSDILGVDVDE